MSDLLAVALDVRADRVEAPAVFVLYNTLTVGPTVVRWSEIREWSSWYVCGASLYQQPCLVTQSEVTCFAWWRIG